MIKWTMLPLEKILSLSTLVSNRYENSFSLIQYLQRAPLLSIIACSLEGMLSMRLLMCVSGTLIKAR